MRIDLVGVDFVRIDLVAPNPPDPALISCPFCAREFKSLGNHLPKCKERHDRDDSSHLSKKTLDRKAKTGSSR